MSTALTSLLLGAGAMLAVSSSAPTQVNEPVELTAVKAGVPVAADGPGEEITFSKHVLPILSDRCFHCHGPDENDRKAGLRLDVEESAKEDFGGESPVLPGDLENSMVWQRIITKSKDRMMPPPDSHRKPLIESERDIIKRWIEGGAQWGKHWSFEPLTRPELPNTKQHPIDAFVTKQLLEDGMKLSEPAGTVTLLRRLSFDLTGLAPTPGQVAAVLEKPGDSAVINQAIEEMFASPHHAERMAMWWLDAARYADSDGFQIDEERQNWPWRDWVVTQFAQNLPYDEFTIEQFAGDLLPSATDQTRLATSFHRQHMTNGEGGRNPEESRIDYVIDRVNTTGSVWLGLTLGCVQCHTHKFDPITHADYYSLFAFFDSIDENGKAGMSAKPYLNVKSSAAGKPIQEMQTFNKQCQAQVDAERKLAEQRFDQWLEAFKADPPKDYHAWVMPEPKMSSTEGTEFIIEAGQAVQTSGPTPFRDEYRVEFQVPDAMTRITGFRLEIMPHESHVNSRYTRTGNGEFTLTSVLAMVRHPGKPSEQQIDLSRAVASVQANEKRKSEWDAAMYAKISDTINDDARNGWTTEGVQDTEIRVGLYQLDEPWLVQSGDRLIVLLRHGSTHGNANIGRFRVAITGELGETITSVNASSPIADLVAELQSDPAKPINVGLRDRLLAQYLLGDEAYQQALEQASAAHHELLQLKKEAGPRKVMVLAERKSPRTTHILERGVWDAKGDKVERGFIPEIFDGPSDKDLTRLDLAKWILDRDNPLTARVTVNHLWQLMLGQGLVRTPGDFGLQGEFPTHPELLDWLAVELIDSGWDLRHILRLIVTSDTYRQSSRASQELREKDPENRFLARASRHRLPSWMIRDNALHVSSLLNDAVGGPPVKPYQPEGVWLEITMGGKRYTPSVGPAQYRRTLYAFWRRNLAPTFLFDTAQRRTCEIGVLRTNTPLHALTLMNDLTMLEASRALADIAVVYQDDVEGDVAKTLNHLSMRVLSRGLSEVEQATMQSVYKQTIDYYRKHADDAMHYTAAGQQAPPTEANAAETAAWMTVSSLFLNLDEAITRE